LALLQEGKSVQRIRKSQRLWAMAKKAAAALALLCLVGAGIAAYLRNNESTSFLAVSLLNDVGTSGTRNVKAAEAYRLGLPALRRGTREGFRQAVQSFTTAAEEDPRFVAAYARLIETYLLDEDGGIGFIDGKAEKLASLAATMERIAPTNAETHAARAVVKFINEWKWAEAETEFRQALQVDPNCRMALTYYGYLLTRLGRRNEAESYLNRALQLEPSSPLVTKLLGHCDFLARDFDKALQFYLKASDLEPSYLSSRYWAGRSYLAMTNYSQAIAEFERFDRKTEITLPEGYHTKRREAFATNGPAGYWRKTIEMRNGFEPDRAAHSAYIFAECYARLGQTNEALTRLDQALARHESGSRLIFDEFWDGFRAQPKFQESLRRIGLLAKKQ
jgi:tetratricopeptide (TPR) repeat protein